MALLYIKQIKNFILLNIYISFAIEKYDDAIIDSPIKPTDRHSGFNYIKKIKKTIR